MLLFSTILDINEFVTESDFITLILEWNRTSTRPENIVRGVDWHGERNARYGDDHLWLEILDHPEKRIIAVRHEKVVNDGITWDSDFIMNFAEMRLAIRLDRTYSEDALIMDAAFSTPHFISLLIRHGYLKSDVDLPVLRTPTPVSDDNIDLFSRLENENSAYSMPVLYVTQTAAGKYPLSVTWLASRLKGAAHVLVEDSIDRSRQLRELCGAARERYGAVRIYYPADMLKMKKFAFRSETGDESVRLEKVIRHVIQYWISQKTDYLYTWQGVRNDVLNHQLDNQISKRMEAESARQKAEDEVDKVYEEFDDVLRELQEKVAELTRANEALQYENQGLRAKLASADNSPLIFYGDEEEFYPGEIRDMVLGSLDNCASSSGSETRRADVIEDILENNPYHHLSEERKQRVKTLFKGYKTLTGTMRQELQDLGFEISEAGKHYKLTYQGDERYMVTIGKTPSDNRSGSNAAALVNKIML